MNIRLEKIEKTGVTQVDFDSLEFGSLFADYMCQASYIDGQWTDFAIRPYQALSFFPAMSSLHYGQSVFEGIKAFCMESGQINIFRLSDHIERLNRSCKRMCIPPLPEKDIIELISTCIGLDKDWVPREQKGALYIRPFVFATDPFIGMRPSKEYTMLVIASPVGDYYKDCLNNPVKLLSSQGEYVRAFPGGTGDVKTSGNYAASMLPARLAKEKGYHQVLWLDAKEGRYIDEVGTMNIFFVINDVLVTPPLYGSVLDGITRRSIITLAQDWGISVEERMISIDEVMNGSVQECFGTGTAAVLSPVSEIEHKGRLLVINNGKSGRFARRFRESIMGIQYGIHEDQHGWNHFVP